MDKNFIGNQILLFVTILLKHNLTPILGLLRNYIKYKRCNINTFLRTPLVYLIFHPLFMLQGYTNVVWRTLIFERWYFFVEKSLISMWNNDYMKNKEKYIKKYGLTY